MARLLPAAFGISFVCLLGNVALGSAPPRGFSIPLLDLASQTNRQVVVDREPGQYLGHPTTVLLEDGRTVLCVYPKGHGHGAITFKRSRDGGLTWSERLAVPESWATSKETPTIHRVIDPAGTKRLILWSGLYPARLAVSEDDGASWSELSTAGDWGGIVVMGCLEPLRTGKGHYLAMFHDDGRFFRSNSAAEDPVRFTLYQTVSTNGGQTWSFPKAVYSSSEVHLCEPGIIRSPDGRRLAVLLRENSRKKNSHVIFSDDEGRTWSEPRELPGALTGDRHTAKYGPDGRLFVSFRDMALESPTRGDWVGWVGTFEDVEQGREGQYRVRLMHNTKGTDCAYPGVELLPEGTFVTTTYGHWTAGQEPYIVSVRFKLSELDAMAKAGGKKDGSASGTSAPADQHRQIGVASSPEKPRFARTTHPDAQWFENAGLGLFIHYGLSSVDGRIDLSWGMMADTPWDKGAFKLTPESYFKLAERFNPDRYNPGKWLRAARDAGSRYAVMTTKHHEGFALWPSHYGDFNTRNFMGGRDLVKPYVEACRANGLKVGLYYSPPDWHFNRHQMSFRYRQEGSTNYVAFGLKHEPILLPEPKPEEKERHDKACREYLRGQIEELLTGYGRIDLLWFDGGPDAISIERIRQLQPGIVVNPRMHGVADFTTAEVNFPMKRPSGWWEMCAIWNSGGWGYTAREDYRSTASVLEEFSRVRAWGGNYLINVGPRSNGELPDIAYERLAELGRWTKQHSLAVLDTQPGSWPEDCNLPFTTKENTRYLFVPPGFTGKIELKHVPRPATVRMLNGGTPIPFEFTDTVGTVFFTMPGQARDRLLDVVEVILPP